MMASDTVYHIKHQKAPSQYWPDNCCYMQTHTMVGTPPMILQTPKHKPTTYPQEPESISQSAHQSEDEKSY
ncbi:hypothetical protein Scep_004976 [Stephania cephalantha]|uniref:Uncharacterized protein n=1 Tax=Stephania cephalantha TaxID=152367 RepID=A0AAP0KV56_9MAGN